MSRPVRPKRIKPGSFLQICLAPSYYTYARQLEGGMTSVAFYDVLVREPLSDLAHLSQELVLLKTSILDDRPWLVVGHRPLEITWPTSWYSWAFDPVSVQSSGNGWDADMQTWLANPSTKYLLVETKRDPITGAIDSIETPANLHDLQGLPRRTIYWPNQIEDKLRLHFGVSQEGESIAPLLLKQQPFW
jgi:hypothetical protein